MLSDQYTFDDVLIEPNFSTVKSRKDVNLATQIANRRFKLPIVSANMTTVTGKDTAIAMDSMGGAACLHRFQSIEDNIKEFNSVNSVPAWVSVGIGPIELDRAKALYDHGARTILLDVAHGASMHVVEQFKQLKRLCPSAELIVGNFATARSIKDFNYHAGFTASAYKVGIGGGAVCTTRVKTGVGMPTLYSVIDCVSTGCNIIADGGHKTPGDIAKSLAIGAKMVMLGSMLAGSQESPGTDNLENIGAYIHGASNALKDDERIFVPMGESGPNRDNIGTSYDRLRVVSKSYKGSASLASYEEQGKMADWRTAEGITTTVPYKGPISSILQDIEGGLRSSLSYVGAYNLTEFREKARLRRVSTSSLIESRAHA